MQALRLNKANRPILKEFTKYATLNTLGLLGISFYIFVDTLFVARVMGEQALAALNLALPISSIQHGVGLMIATGSATRFQIERSRGNEKAAQSAFMHALFYWGITSVVFLMLGFFASDALTRAFGADASVFDMSKTYLKTMLMFAPAYNLNHIFVNFTRNDSRPRLAMITMVASSLSNVLLDYVFMMPLGMGIFGAALASGLSPVISMALLSPYLLSKKRTYRLSKLKLSLVETKKIVGAGFPTLSSEVSSGTVMLVFNLIILGIAGNTGVAAYGVISNLSLVLIAIFQGLSGGTQPLFSRSYGQKDARTIRVLLRYALIAAAVVGLAAYMVLLFGGEAVATLFNRDNNPEMQTLAVRGLAIYYAGSIFCGVNLVLSTYYTATGKARPAHIIALLRGFVLIIPFAFLMSHFLGMDGVWSAFPMAEALTTVVAIVFLVFTLKKQKTELSVHEIPLEPKQSE